MLTFDTIRDIKICQHERGYRFSIDALLLFSFVNLQRANMIIDLGTGSGIVGILLSKKYPEAKLTLVELQKGLAKIAEENIKSNDIQDRATVINKDINELCALGNLSSNFDIVVSNPPFRKLKSGLMSCVDERAIARHEIKMSLNDLISVSSYLLKHNGRLYIIHLPERLKEIFSYMSKNSIEPKRLRFVHSKISSEAKMVLIEGVKAGKPSLKIDRPFIIYDEEGNYTEETRGLY